MSAILYPIARTADGALAAPLGRARLMSEAKAVAGVAVVMATEPAGPAFTSREAALDAFAGRIDDERPGRRVSVASADRYCDLVLFAASPRAAATTQRPVFKDGRRWPSPRKAPVSEWRLLVRYWRVASAEEAAAAPAQARRVRRHARSAGLDARALRALADQPLRPFRPQQPLDLGLFEIFAPEDPTRLLTDE